MMTWIIRSIAPFVGSRSLRALVRNKGPDYEAVLPNATYSPWNLDKAFIAAYSQIKDATLVDKYRCFELWRLVEQCAKLEGGALIEIGVWRGGTAALIATQAKNLGLRERSTPAIRSLAS
jgi:hypothetical protein